MMDDRVLLDNRPKGAGTQAVNQLNGEEAVRGDYPRFDAELLDSLVKQESGTTHVTGCSHTERQNVFSNGLKAERLVERSYTEDLNQGNP